MFGEGGGKKKYYPPLMRITNGNEVYHAVDSHLKFKDENEAREHFKGGIFKQILLPMGTFYKKYEFVRLLNIEEMMEDK